MVVCLPDTQDGTPDIPIYLSRVGVTGVKKLLSLKRKEKRPIILVPTFDAFVDLPSDQKGTHMSRTPEAISEVVDEVATNSSIGVEEICADIVRKMLEKHEYAKRVEVNMRSEYMFMRESPVTRKPSQEMGILIANAVGKCDDDGNISIRKSIGAEVIGMTVCPCAQESVREVNKNSLLEFLDEETCEKVLEKEVPENQTVDGEKIIEIIESSMSSPVCELLKRPDENAVVMNAHENPVFVEDCVRTMNEKIIKEFSYLPDDTKITTRQENQESIHRHNAFAEKVSTLGALKEELNLK